MNKIIELLNKKVELGAVRKWLIRIATLAILIIMAKYCVTSCTEVMQDKREEAVAQDSIPKSYNKVVNPTFPLAVPEGDLKCLTVLALSEIDKYTNRNPYEAPMLEAVEYYIEGVILDQFRKVNINDEVLDTLSWARYQRDTSYRIDLWERIITK